MPTPKRLTALFIGVLVLATACSSADTSASSGSAAVTSDRGEEQGSSDASTAVTTTTLAPQPPRISAPDSTFAEIGQSVSEAVIVTDPNNDETVIRLLDHDAPGLQPRTNVRGRIIGFDWEPTEPGEWDAVFTATDAGGLTSTATVRLIARNEPSIDMFYVMGDSIAAGFGRDRIDFVGTDDCFRSEADSYGAFAFEGLVDAGALGAEAELVFVACDGIGADDLAIIPTRATSGQGNVIGDPLTQLARATQLNPTIITLTVGARDIGIFGLDELITVDAGQDPDIAVGSLELPDRIESVRSELSEVLDVLVNTTSAHVVVTTMYNPVASAPVGVQGCVGQCLVEVSNAVVAAYNEMVIGLVENQRPGRVSLARLDGDADVWEAPNGAGIDVLRDGLGPLQGLVDTFTSGSNALCADDDGVDDPRISSLDCAHPNTEGHRAIAEVVIGVLLAI